MRTRLAPCRESGGDAELTGQFVLEKSQYKQGAGHETKSGSETMQVPGLVERAAIW